MPDTTPNPMSKVIARAWADPAYQQLLQSDPATALAQEGVEVPAGHTVQVHQDDATTSHLVLPAKPANLGPAGAQTTDLVCFSPVASKLLVCFFAQRAQAASDLGNQIAQHATDLVCFHPHAATPSANTGDLVCFKPAPVKPAHAVTDLVCFAAPPKTD